MAEFPESGDRLATVFGGSGFIGRYVVRAFARAGWRVRAAVRRPDLAGFLATDGVVGQVQPVQANVRFPASVEAVTEPSDSALIVAVWTETRSEMEVDSTAARAWWASSPRKALLT